MEIQDTTLNFRKLTGKVEKYKWAQRHGPGNMVMIPKRELLVDPEYQRNLNNNKRLAIASNFNWAAFGVLVVVRRKNGKLYVVDGQHRLAGAMSREDITTVPCIVFELPGGIQEEATDFLALNTLRKPLSGYERFAALVVSGDVDAIHVQDKCLRHNLPTGNHSGRGLRCLMVAHHLSSTNREVFDRIFPVIADLFAEMPVDSRILRGLFYLESSMTDDKGESVSITQKNVREKILQAGFPGLTDSINSSESFFRRRGPKVWAYGVLNEINRKRKNKLSIGSESAPDA